MTLLRPQSANMVFSARNPGGRVTTRHVSVFTRKEFFFPLREVQCENFGKHRKVWKRVQRVSLCPVPDSVPLGAACTHLVGPGASTLGRYPGQWYIPPRGQLAVHTLGVVSTFPSQPPSLQSSGLPAFKSLSRGLLPEESNLLSSYKTKHKTR